MGYRFFGAMRSISSHLWGAKSNTSRKIAAVMVLASANLYCSQFKRFRLRQPDLEKRHITSAAGQA
jgi:hypothetical protein